MSPGVRWSLLVFVVWLVAALAACGDNLAPASPDAGGADAHAGPPDAPPFVMGEHPSAPQVVSEGGPVLAAPKVVAIFFAADDPLRADTDAFLHALVGSSYWTAVAHEYGVGDLSVAPMIVTTDAAPTSDADIQTYVATMSDGTHDGWPTNDGSTIYTLFLPSGDTLSDFPGQCSSWGGYHAEAAGTGAAKVVYAVIPRCAVSGDFLYPLTLATSHELLEASTDPFPFTAPAYDILDADHYAWNSTPGGELGDMCEYVRAASTRGPLSPYAVQRQWSNAAAAAGTDPCVPQEKAFLGVAPVLTEDLVLKVRNGMVTTKGVSIPAGTSKTIDVQLWTDAATPEFTVNAYDVASKFKGRTAELTFAWDKQTGKNGDTLHLTITHVKAATRGASEFVLFAGPDTDTQSQFWGLVGN